MTTPVVAAPMCRVSLVGHDTHVDVALPTQIPIGLLMSDIVGLIERQQPQRRRLTDKGEVWTLGRIGETAITSETTLSEAGVCDGEVLIVQSVDSHKSVALFDDVIDAVSRLGEDTGQLWDRSTAKAFGLACTIVLSIIGVGVLAGAILTDPLPRFIFDAPRIGLVIMAITFTVGAITAARLHRDAATTRSLAACQCFTVFALTLLALPGIVTGAHVALAGFSVAMMCVVTLRISHLGFDIYCAATVFGIFLTAAGIFWWIYPSRLTAVASLTLALSIIILTNAPRLTIALTRLPIPPVPTAGASIDPIDVDARPNIQGIGAIGAMTLPSGKDLAARAAAAQQYLQGILLGSGLVLVSSLVTMITSFDGVSQRKSIVVMVLSLIACSVIALRGRAYADRLHAGSLVITAILGMVAIVICSLCFPPNTVVHHIAVGTVFVAIPLTFTCGVIAPKVRFSPVAQRTGEIVEYLLIGLVMPLSVWVADLYNAVRSM